MRRYQRNTTEALEEPEKGGSHARTRSEILS